MKPIRNWLLAAVGVFALAGLTAAQEVPEGVEVLARGPIHEAYASTVEVPAGGYPIIVKAPPEPIEELPPDQKPEGDNVQWVPGYWHYDEDRTDFIWISGFWRVPPPGRVWLPGSWREARGGFQWVPGFWQDATPAQPEMQYLPPPPLPLEIAPSVPAPSESYYYVPGNWVYRGRYLWQPGYWVDHRPGWIWCPSHYRWTPAGHIYVDGYWDYTLADRGVLFAPVYFSQPVYRRPRYVYAPIFVVSEPSLYTSLFIRRGYSSYYFGDYHETRYINAGYNPWCGTGRASGFSVSIGFSRGGGYDPLWDYYRVSNRSNPGWQGGVNSVYAGRYEGRVARPPVNLTQQARVINNVTNNNTTIINNNITNVTNTQTNMTMLTTINNAQTTNNTANNRVAFKPIDAEARTREQKIATETRDIGRERKRVEATMTAPVKPTDAPRTAKIEVPKAVVQRAQVTEERKAAMPPPAPKIANQPAPKVEPRVKPNVDPKDVRPKVTPVPMPKVDPKDTKPVTPAPMPKVDPKDTKPVPMPKVDPKDTKPVMPVPAPKVDPPKPVPPIPAPKVDPKPLPPVPVPKVDPPKPVPPIPAPKVDPKPLPPVPMPKVDPPKPVTPQPAPKVDPPKPVVPAPMPKPVVPQPAPKVDPPKPVAPPVVPRPLPPKVDPPKPVIVPPVVPRPLPPKVDPPKPVIVPPVVPRVDPPKTVAPRPLPPKGEQPKEGDKPKEPKKP